MSTDSLADLAALPHGTILLRIEPLTGEPMVIQRAGTCWLDPGCSDPVPLVDVPDWIGSVIITAADIYRMAAVADQRRKYDRELAEVRMPSMLCRECNEPVSMSNAFHQCSAEAARADDRLVVHLDRAELIREDNWLEAQDSRAAREAL